MPQTMRSDFEVAFFIFERVIPPKMSGKIPINPNIIPKMINTLAAVFTFSLLYVFIRTYVRHIYYKTNPPPFVKRKTRVFYLYFHTRALVKHNTRNEKPPPVYFILPTGKICLTTKKEKTICLLTRLPLNPCP